MSLSKVADPKTTLIISERILNILIPGISGALAGCLSTAILYPIENVKTRMQALAKAEREGNADLEIGKSKKPRNAFDTVADILEKEGAKGFYKGMTPYLLATLTTFGVYFFWYELLKPLFIKDQFSLLGYTKTALFASSITTTATNPFWVLHTRILLEKGKNLGLFEAIKKILDKEGVAGFYKGVGAGYMLVLNPISQFIIYEYLKKTFENTKYKSAMIFLAGAISKAIATFLTYPLQTLKTNLQANKHRNINPLQMAQEIFEKRGLKGFYAGLNAKLSQTVINSALVLVIYERIQAIVKKVLIALLSQKRF